MSAGKHGGAKPPLHQTDPLPDRRQGPAFPAKAELRVIKVTSNSFGEISHHLIESVATPL